MACRILLLLVLAQACHTVSGCMRRQEGTLPLDDDGTSQDQRSTRQQDINNHVDMNQAQQIQISKDIAMTNLLARSAASTAFTSTRKEFVFYRSAGDMASWCLSLISRTDTIRIG